MNIRAVRGRRTERKLSGSRERHITKGVQSVCQFVQSVCQFVQFVCLFVCQCVCQFVQFLAWEPPIKLTFLFSFKPSWSQEKSVKQRFPVHSKHVPALLEGVPAPESHIKRMAAANGMDKQEEQVNVP